MTQLSKIRLENRRLKDKAFFQSCKNFGEKKEKKVAKCDDPKISVVEKIQQLQRFIINYKKSAAEI